MKGVYVLKHDKPFTTVSPKFKYDTEGCQKYCRKGENAGNQHFLLFSTIFFYLPFQILTQSLLPQLNCIQIPSIMDKSNFLAHQSTACSRGAFRMVRCPSSVVLRQQFL